MRRAQEATTSRCDLCGSVRAEPIFATGDRRFGVPGRFTVVRCRGCGLCRTHPQPSDPTAYYPAERYYTFAPPRAPSRRALERVRVAYGTGPQKRARRLLANVAAARLAPGLPPGPPGRLLDVGCGSGEALLALDAAGWDARGLDVDARAVRAARSAGASADVGELPDSDYPDESFDAVRFWHSLEHTRSPRAQLAAARRVLRRGGSVTIGVPNFASLLARVSRERWFYLDVPRHLWHFDRRSLRRLAEEEGFVVDRVALVSTPTPLLGTLDGVLGGRTAIRSHRGAWLAALPLATLLDRLGLGDGLELTARRP